MNEYDVQIGQILGAHGLRGEVKVASLSDIPGRFATLSEVAVRTARTMTVRRVLGARETGPGTWLLRLEGIGDRTTAEALRGAALLVREVDSPSLPPDVYYIHQLIGLRVVTTDGREVGTISEVIETGANDVYVTENALIPAIPQVVQAVDLEGGTMLIEPMPGLLGDE